MSVHFQTQLFQSNTPCLYFNVTSTHLPLHVTRHDEDLFSQDEDIGRITINDAPHWMVLRLIARYMSAHLNSLGLHYSITSPNMNSLDIDAIMADPACDPKAPFMVNRKIPVQIVVQGTMGVMRYLELQVLYFLTRQLLGKTFGDAEKNHMYIREIIYLR